MNERIRLGPEYDPVERVLFAFRHAFFDERFGYGKTIAELVNVLSSASAIDIFAERPDFQILEPQLLATGVSPLDFDWHPFAPPEIILNSFMPIFGHTPEGEVVGLTFDYLHNHASYAASFRECEQFAIEYLGERGILRIHMPFDFATARVAVSDSLVLVSDAHNRETLDWLGQHVTQECVPVPYMRTEHTKDLDVFVLPVGDNTWVVTQFEEDREELRTTDAVIGVLRELRQDVVLVPGLERIVYDDVNCLPNYANSLLVNGIAVVPQYGRAEDEVPLRVLSELGYETFGIDGRLIAQSNAVFHCISKTVPDDVNCGC